MKEAVAIIPVLICAFQAGVIPLVAISIDEGADITNSHKGADSEYYLSEISTRKRVTIAESLTGSLNADGRQYEDELSTSRFARIGSDDPIGTGDGHLMIPREDRMWYLRCENGMDSDVNGELDICTEDQSDKIITHKSATATEESRIDLSDSTYELYVPRSVVSDNPVNTGERQSRIAPNDKIWCSRTDQKRVRSTASGSLLDGIYELGALRSIHGSNKPIDAKEGHPRIPQNVGEAAGWGWVGEDASRSLHGRNIVESHSTSSTFRTLLDTHDVYGSDNPIDADNGPSEIQRYENAGYMKAGANLFDADLKGIDLATPDANGIRPSRRFGVFRMDRVRVKIDWRRIFAHARNGVIPVFTGNWVISRSVPMRCFSSLRGTPSRKSAIGLFSTHDNSIPHNRERCTIQ